MEDTAEHVRRHRKSDREMAGGAERQSSVATSVVLKEPQVRPIVEPMEFVVKPKENFYVLERINKGGRSSFNEKKQSHVLQTPPTVQFA